MKPIDTIYLNEFIQKLIDEDATIHEATGPIFKFCGNRMATASKDIGTVHSVNTERLDKDDPVGDLYQRLKVDTHVAIYKINNRYILSSGDEYYASLTTIKIPELTGIDRELQDIVDDFQEGEDEHEDGYQQKRNEQLLDYISEFGNGFYEFHTIDVERLIKQNMLMRRKLNANE